MSKLTNYNSLKHPRRGDYEAAKALNDRAQHLTGTIRSSPYNNWNADTLPELARRIQAVMDLIGIEPTLQGFRRGFFWLLANPGIVTGLQLPLGERPVEETEPLPPSLAKLFPLESKHPVKDRTHTLLSAYRQHQADGLNKADAAKLTAAEFNAAARQQADADSKFKRPKLATPASIEILDRRHRELDPDELPLYGLAEAVQNKKRDWPHELERLGPPVDFFVLSVELKLEALANGKCTPEDFQESMQILTQQHLESYALGVDARHFRTKTPVFVASVKLKTSSHDEDEQNGTTPPRQ